MASGSRKINAMAHLPSSSTDILLVDDSVVELRLLIDLMSGLKYRVSVAFDGDKGYQLAQLQMPSLILMDVSMPGVDGFAACRLLKANPATQKIPVIFLTASTSVEQRLEGFAAGAVDYVTKPFAEEELLARVAVHLNLAARLVAAEAPLASAAELTAATATTATPGPHGTRTAQPASPDLRYMDAVLVTAAQKILQETLATPPSLDALARKLGSNRRRVNEAFDAVCGVPVFTWVREQRMAQAHFLVSTTDTPLVSISEHLGFSTQANFSKAFRDRFGCPPRALRADKGTAQVDGML
jgi:DNA-binding response OmpR family regulator